ncbi:MAG TPA: C-terminal helicase domain-containing protein, partial [Gemmatimonadaceae bacterium]|nr:C-terminal helicase domain-containing protein [Gemmatimonadaceae bacterium]
RLESAEPTRQQRLVLTEPHEEGLAPTGIRFLPVRHADHRQRSVEEAERVDRIYRSLLGQRWVNEKGETREIGVADILVVSPYNMQVNLLSRTLPPGARVGTVDKFQGQEAAAVLISMAASSGATASRGVTFLLAADRLNVALSRARCWCGVVCSSELIGTPCHSIEQMSLVSTFARLLRG